MSCECATSFRILVWRVDVWWGESCEFTQVNNALKFTAIEASLGFMQERKARATSAGILGNCKDWNSLNLLKIFQLHDILHTGLCFITIADPPLTSFVKDISDKCILTWKKIVLQVHKSYSFPLTAPYKVYSAWEGSFSHQQQHQSKPL